VTGTTELGGHTQFLADFGHGNVEWDQVAAR